MGSVCWGHQTAIEITQDDIRTFAGNWTGTGEAQGSGDAEVLALNAGESMVSEVYNSGVGLVTLGINQYNSGDSATISYKQGATSGACTADYWHLYSTPFECAGYCQIRVEIPVTDSFTYSNGELESVSSSVWTKASTHADSGVLNVDTEKVKYASGTNEAFYKNSQVFGSKYVYSQIYIDTWNTVSEDVGVAINVGAANSAEAGFPDCYVAYAYTLSGGTHEITCWKVLSDAWTQLGTTQTDVTIAAGGTLRIVHESGNDIRVYYNGVKLANPGAVDTDLAYATAGIAYAKHGQVSRIDNWQGGSE